VIRKMLLVLTIATLCVTAQPVFAATTSVTESGDTVRVSVPPMTDVTVKVSPAHAKKPPYNMSALLEAMREVDFENTHSYHGQACQSMTDDVKKAQIASLTPIDREYYTEAVALSAMTCFTDVQREIHAGKPPIPRFLADASVVPSRYAVDACARLQAAMPLPVPVLPRVVQVCTMPSRGH
jgi:hypothetical protein